MSVETYGIKYSQKITVFTPEKGLKLNIMANI